jgi:hypothetical protein
MQRGLLVVGLAVCLLVGAAPLAVAASEPTLSLAVDDTPMASGDELVVPENPVLAVNASAAAGATVERLVVRVDDRTVRTWTPGSEAVSERLTLDLPNEPQPVQVVVTDSEGRVTSREITVERDQVAPFIGFSEPFESGTFGKPPAEVTVSDSRVTLAGTLTDAAGVEFVRIVREHRVEESFGYQVVSRTQTVRDPGDSFERELALGPGENTVRVVVQDRFGNSRNYRISFIVADVTEPALSFDVVPRQTSSSTVFLNGTATDNVQVDSVSYAVFDRVGRRSIVVGQGRTVDPDRKQITFSHEVELRPGPNRITVWATDTSGNEVQELVVVDYVRNVAPTVSVDAERTHRAGDGLVHLYGAARDGRVKSVSVETVDEAGSVVDFEQVYDGDDVWNDIEFDEELALAETGETTVVVRAVDVDGTEHVTSYVVPARSSGTDPADGDDAAGNDGPTTPPGTTTPAANASAAQGSGTTGTATAVEDGGFGAFAVAALLVVLVSFARLRNATVEIPIEKYVDLDDTSVSLPSLPRLRR